MFSFSNEIRTRGFVHEAYSSSEQDLFIATDQEVRHFDLSLMRKEQVLVKRIGVRDLQYSSDHALWITLDPVGLLRYDLHEGSNIQFNQDPQMPGSLLGDILISTFEDFSGNLWIGHRGDGLSILNLE